MDIERELQSPEVRANPYPFYARLRQTAPVIPFKQSLFGAGVFLTRYEDVYNALKDPRFVSNRANAVEGAKSLFDSWWMPRVFKLFQDNMIGHDGADHRRLRNLVHKAFTPARIERLSARIEQLVGELLDAAAKKPTADLIADFALPLPLIIISEMLGVPHGERFAFRRMMGSLLESLGNLSLIGIALNVPNGIRLDRFFRRLVRMRRQEPGDDLITALVQAEESGDHLTEEELVATVFLLLFAGHETTVNLIGNGTLALLENPEQLRKLREHPELIDSAVEELLRYSNPVEQTSPRFVREDVEIKGYKLPRGSMVLPLLASANRDEAAFENADRLDITRNPNRHVSFGHGVHYCLGAPLARLEARTALLHLVQRFPELSLAVAPEKLVWRKNTVLHGLQALPLRLGRDARAGETVRAAG